MKNIQSKFLPATQTKKQAANCTKEITLSDASANILLHHLTSFQNNDIEAVMNDYTNDSVFITQDAIYTGIEEIKAFFTNLSIHFPKQHSAFELDKMTVKDELGYITWHAKTPTLNVFFGTDTFILRDGKIIKQTFAAQMKFIN